MHRDTMIAHLSLALRKSWVLTLIGISALLAGVIVFSLGAIIGVMTFYQPSFSGAVLASLICMIGGLLIQGAGERILNFCAYEQFGAPDGRIFAGYLGAVCEFAAAYGAVFGLAIVITTSIALLFVPFSVHLVALLLIGIVVSFVSMFEMRLTAGPVKINLLAPGGAKLL
ncbi:hypothetical protein ACOI1H_20665 [Loktanella sp. DJP18]|uniref:hypothetical protein n=1 Tax=Loktanella sp. DJP18 TaxID=3409788 RepID=UPI003BB4A32A